MCNQTPTKGASNGAPLGVANEEQLRNYFQNLLQLKQSNYRYPVNLDDVWPIGYSTKSNAVKSLRKHFFEGVDYVVIKNSKDSDNRQLFQMEENQDSFVPFGLNAENQEVEENINKGGRTADIYYLTISCMEYLVARCRREVFDIYSKVFDAYVGIAEQQARAQAEAIREAPVETRPDGRRIFLDYRLFSHRFYLMTSTADYEMESYCKELIGRLQEGWQMPVDANEVYSLLGFSSAVNLTTFMKGGNARKVSTDSPYKYEEDYICTKSPEQQNRTYRLISIGAFGRLLKMLDASPRFRAIYHRYFPEDNMRQDEIKALYPVGLTISQHTADPEARITEALHGYQLLQDDAARRTFGTGCKPSPVTGHMVQTSAPEALPDDLRSTRRLASPSFAAAPLPSAPIAADSASSFTRLFASIMSMRGRVPDTQIVETLYDLRRLAGI